MILDIRMSGSPEDEYIYKVHPWGIKIKFTPGEQSSTLGDKVQPWGTKFNPGGQSSPLGGKVHP
jgi:hypothetical protein